METRAHRSIAGRGCAAAVLAVVALVGARVNAAPECPRCAAPIAVGHLENDKIREPSGLVASALHDGVYFTHDDSGHKPRFYALDGAGKDLGTFTVTGAENVDWEDAARGPCGAESCLFFGDIGEGKKTRATYALYRVQEPKTLGAGTKQEVRADVLPFRYPDGTHDAETLLVHPQTGAIWVVTKTKHAIAGVYAVPLPLTPGVLVTLQRVGEVQLPDDDRKLTAGDIHPQGTSVLLRTKANVWLFPVRAGESVPDALGHAPCKLPAPPEVQGESITWTRSGTGYLTLTEAPGAELHQGACAPR